MKKSLDIKSILIPLFAAVMFFVFVAAIYSCAGSQALTQHSPYDSYTLQAMAWRRGQAKLDQNYPYLELAIVNDEYFATHDMDDYESYRKKFGDINAPIEDQEGNEYYVSFPPFPSVPMFILSFIFGENTPSTMMSVLYTTGAFLFSILICRRFRLSYTLSICGAAFVCLASSALSICTNMNAGGVWFMAQALSLLLTIAAFYFILGNKNRDYYLAFILLAFAVGCRPFQIVYYLPFAYIVAKKYEFKIFRTWKFYVGPAIIGGLYMIYNYIRFGNPLEFGHNYLPEFMRMPAGQFGFEYFAANLKSILTDWPVLGEEGLTSQFGFAFYLSNVIFILLVVALIFKSTSKNMKSIKNAYNIELYILGGVMLIHLLFFTLHKTLGGWQFGSRYTVDIIPAALVFICMSVAPVIKSKKAPDKVPLIVFYSAAAFLLISGCVFNVYGSLNMF